MSSDEDMQDIPARHGTATFVPKGSTIKIVNSSGTQIIDTWVFALPDPPKSLKPGSAEEKSEQDGEKKEDEEKQDEKKEEPKQEEAKKQEKKPAESPNVKKGRKSKDDMGLPTQEEAEAATKKGNQEEEQKAQSQAQGTPQKAGWSSYLPSLRGSGKKQQPQKEEAPAADAPAAEGAEDKKDAAASDKAQQKANSRTWGSYLSTGQGFTSYLPSKGAISAFASSHQRDTSKSYAEQLTDFSKTPVGAASFSALTGSGAAGSLYAGYSAWSAKNGDIPPMEYLSLSHTRATTMHLCPQVNDVLVSNLREPMVTLIEDTSKGRHDTLMAACDPRRYKELGVESWEEHGSCAENLVLALKELNERAGLKGEKGIGADITINSVPGPLNLFMNVPWQGDKGELKFAAPDNKEGDYVRFRAERDVVVIMSACPQDMTDINGTDRLPQDGHFIVETPDDDSDDEDVRKKLQKATETKKPRAAPKKLGSSAAGSKRSSVQVDKKPEDVAPAEAKKETPKPAEAKKETPKPAEAKKETPKPAEAKKEAPKPAEAKKEAPKLAEKKSSDASSSSTPTPASAPAAEAKPKAKPKKLTDPSTGEKKKPRKLEPRAKPTQASS